MVSQGQGENESSCCLTTPSPSNYAEGEFNKAGEGEGGVDEIRGTSDVATTQVNHMLEPWEQVFLSLDHAKLKGWLIGIVWLRKVFLGLSDYNIFQT